jgi:hypothetical protein
VIATEGKAFYLFNPLHLLKTKYIMTRIIYRSWFIISVR